MSLTPKAAPSAKPAHAARKPGRPPYEAADKDRVIVRLLCAGGITQDRIALAIGISEPTLRKHYKRDILIGQTEIDALAVGTLVSAMRSGGKEAVTAAIWWQKSRMGWAERVIVDDGKLADTPMRVIVELVGDAAPARTEHPRQSQSGFDVARHVQLVG